MTRVHEEVEGALKELEEGSPARSNGLFIHALMICDELQRKWGEALGMAAFEDFAPFTAEGMGMGTVEGRQLLLKVAKGNWGQVDVRRRWFYVRAQVAYVTKGLISIVAEYQKQQEGGAYAGHPILPTFIERMFRAEPWGVGWKRELDVQAAREMSEAGRINKELHMKYLAAKHAVERLSYLRRFEIPQSRVFEPRLLQDPQPPPTPCHILTREGGNEHEGQLNKYRDAPLRWGEMLLAVKVECAQEMIAGLLEGNKALQEQLDEARVGGIKRKASDEGAPSA